jgi:hypothetical protein
LHQHCAPELPPFLHRLRWLGVNSAILVRLWPFSICRIADLETVDEARARLALHQNGAPELAPLLHTIRSVGVRGIFASVGHEKKQTMPHVDGLVPASSTFSSVSSFRMAKRRSRAPAAPGYDRRETLTCTPTEAVSEQGRRELAPLQYTIGERR